MAYFAGLDVSVKETSVCIVDDAGKIVREARVASEPEALLQVLTNTIYRFTRVGLEAGPLSQWLYSVLAEAGFPVICVETRHMRAPTPTATAIRSPRHTGKMRAFPRFAYQACGLCRRYRIDAGGLANVGICIGVSATLSSMRACARQRLMADGELIYPTP